MSAFDEFRSQFAEDGRYRRGDGLLAVVFATRGGGRFPGKLHFKNGLCIRAEMERGGDWVRQDESPLDEVRFLLDFGNQKLYGIVLDAGRVLPLEEMPDRSTKRDFLENVRIARNLFAHSHAPADTKRMNTSATARAAIWLTPNSVARFNASDFAELGPNLQQELLAAVQSFLIVANQVPSDKPATSEQYGNAIVAFTRILGILRPYLPLPDEAQEVETAIHTIEFPAWVVNWDYEFGSDPDGVAAVWVNVFADDQSVPRAQLGRSASELTTKVRQAFGASKIERWPYIRLKTALEHKTVRG